MRRETFENWIILCAKYFGQYYQCEITLPDDLEDDQSKTDGLHLYFYNFQWDCLINNWTLHYIHDRLYNRRQGMIQLKEYITMRLEAEIFTPKGLKFKDKAFKHSFQLLEDKSEIEFMRPRRIRND